MRGPDDKNADAGAEKFHDDYRESKSGFMPRWIKNRGAKRLLYEGLNESSTGEQRSAEAAIPEQPDLDFIRREK